eukprot:TRINITY_DN105_c0_g1_i1.p1 TRINITY_DN105_c0_g1~~TRINITY_DN105_c0_g1_i1.p1  ORF type:complete len:959 (-),score=188.22 TRINITY_DN105_c0_g1_i1:34-2910(-)
MGANSDVLGPWRVLTAWEIALVSALQQRDIRILKYAAVIARWLVSDELMGILMAALSWTTGPKKATMVVLCTNLSEIFNGCIKWWIQRPRPSWIEGSSSHRLDNMMGVFETDFSFPSSHAQVIASIGLSILFQYELARWLQIVVIATVILTGLARIYLGVHFASDVVVGWILGCLPPILLQHVDIFEEFNLFPFPYKLLTSVVVAVLFHALLGLVRVIVPQVPNELVQQWEKTAHKNERKPSTKRIRVRQFDRYHFVIWTTVFGVIVVAFGIHDHSLRFVHEVCTAQDFLSGNTLLRAVGGLLFILLVNLPGLFVLPSLIASANCTSRRRVFAAFLVKMFFCATFAAWSWYIWPRIAAQHYGLQCKYTTVLDHPPPMDQMNPTCKLQRFPPQFHALAQHGAEIEVMQSVEQLRATIVQAAGQKRKLRVVGAGHSQQFAHEQQSNTTFIALNSAPFKHYRLVHDDNGPLVYVGAGLSLSANPDTATGWDDCLLVQLWRDGLALANVPGVVVQSVGGLLSTSSDGGSLSRSIFSSVQGIKFVNGRGEIHFAWRNDTNTELFRAVSLSNGLLGVIIEVVLRPVPAFCTRPLMYAELDTLSYGGTKRVAEHVAHDLLQHDDAYVRVLTISMDNHVHAAPFKEDHHQTDVEVSYQVIKEVKGHSTDNWCGTGITPDAFFSNASEYSFMPPFTQLTMTLLQGYAAQPECTMADVVHSPLMQELKELSENDLELTVILEHCVAEIEKLNRTEVALYGLTAVQSAVCNVGSTTVPPLPVRTKWDTGVAPYFYSLAFEQMIDFELMGASLSELLIQLDSVHDETTVARVLETLYNSTLQPPTVDSAHGNALSSFCLNEFFMSPAVDSLLSPSRGKPSLRFSLITLKWVDAYTVFKHFWQVFAQSGLQFTMHWGKMLPTEPGDESLLCALRSSYGDSLETFKRIAEEHDPLQVFRTAYWSRVFWDDLC